MKGLDNPYTQKTRLFSLTELLVVVAIFVVLFSLLNPALRNMVETSQLIHCKNNLKILHSCAILYAENYDGYAYYYQQHETELISRQLGTPPNPQQIRHMGVYIAEGLLPIDSEEPQALFCPSSTYAPGWKVEQPGTNGRTPKKGFQIGHDVRTSYMVNEPLAASYFTPRYNIWGHYPGFIIDNLPYKIGFAADVVLKTTQNKSYEIDNHLNKFNFINIDGASDTFYDHQRLIPERPFQYFNQYKSRLDIGVKMRGNECLFDLFNDFFFLPL